MKQVMTIVGARPQFIKAAVVSRAIRATNGALRETFVHTGQHFDSNMSDVFFDQLAIPRPDVHLGIGGGSHGRNTGRMIEALETAIIDHRPDGVLIYGDTDSTLAAAIAAAKLHVPIAHVEAGLRSFNRRMPEEVNRVLADHASTLLFTPTTTATTNLKNEGITGSMVHQVGDVMYDAAFYYRDRAREPSERPTGDRFVLATLHRAENTDDPVRLASIVNGLVELSRTMPVVLPVHPRTRKVLAQHQLDTGGIQLCDPVGYLEMVWLLTQCSIVVTDSGGLQKEAYFFGKRCVTTRDETEWVELVSLGWNTIVGADTRAIVAEVERALRLSDHRSSSDGSTPFGRGDAGTRIVEILGAA